MAFALGKRVALEELCELQSMLLLVIVPMDECILEGDSLMGSMDVVGTCLEKILEREARVDGHNLTTLSIRGCVQTDSKSDGRESIGQVTYAGGNAHGGYSDVAIPNTQIFTEHRHCSAHVGHVCQGLPHAHHHHVADALASLHQRPSKSRHLLHNLMRSKLALESLLACRAERTSHGAARLRGYAHRVSGVSILHKYGFDSHSIAQLV